MGSSQTPSGGSGSGDMVKTTYDPTNVEGDAFDMDNMVEGDTNLILTDGERTKISEAMTNPMTTEGDIIYGDTDGVPAVLAKGDDGQILKLASGVPVWDDEYSYTLPTASDSVLGGVKVGSGLSITDGVLSATGGGGGATLWTTWNASRTDDSTIASNSSDDDLPVGTAIRYKATAGNYEYGIILSRTDRAHTIMGHPCTTDDDDVFEYDASHLKVHSETIHLAGNFNAADSNSFLASYDLMQLGWMPAIADEYYLVGIFTVCDDADGSLDPNCNIVIQGGTNKIFDTDIGIDEAEQNTGSTVDDTNRYYALGLKSRLDILIDKDYDPGEGEETGAGDAYDADITFIFVKA